MFRAQEGRALQQSAADPVDAAWLQGEPGCGGGGNSARARGLHAC